MKYMYSIEGTRIVAPIAALIGLFALTPVANATQPFPQGSFDGGGYVSDYFDLVASANERGSHVAISGTCASACTMKLGIRHVCVQRDASLWFHAAHNSDGSINSLGTRIMMRQYPRGIRRWVRHHRALSTKNITAMSGSVAIALGVRECGGHSD